MSKNESCLCERVVEVVIPQLQEGEEDHARNEHEDPFQNNCVLETVLEGLATPHPSVLESVYLGNAEQLENTPDQEDSYQGSQCESRVPEEVVVSDCVVDGVWH